MNNGSKGNINDNVVNMNAGSNEVAANHVKQQQQNSSVVVNMDTSKGATGTDIGQKQKKIRFKYTVKDKNGKVINGYFDAVSKVDVHSFLLAQEYEIVNIEEDALSTKLGLASILPQKKMKSKDLNFFLTQLSTYIKSGIPLVESVAILSRQTKKKDQKYLYQRIVFELNKGNSFSEALELQGNSFPKLVLNMVKTSELTGDLTSVLDDLATYYKNADATRKQIKSAMTYPTVILIFAIFIVAFVLIYVVPQFVDIYGEAGTELPLITKITIAVSNFLQTNYYLLILAFVLLVVLLVVLYKKVKSFRRTVQIILMHIPVVNKIVIYNEVVMFTSTFASLVNHDVFITDSMAILKQISNNEIYKELISKAIDNLAKGEGVSKSFEDHWAFPPQAYEMLATGERTGRLGPMMQTVADYFQGEQANIVTQLKALIEPIMIILLAMIVGVILLSIVLPMFSLYGGLI